MSNTYTLGRHKATFTLELTDGSEVQLTAPSLSAFKRMMALQDNANVDDLIDVVCDILNCNRTGATFTPKEVAALFAFDDLIGFFDQYRAFVASVSKAKN